MLANMPRIPVGSFIEALVVFIQNSFAPLLDAVSKYVDMALLNLEALLKFLPPVVLLAIIALIAWRLANRGVAIFTGIGLFLIYNFGLWSSAMETLATVLVATLLALVLAIPLGICTARSDLLHRVFRPVLDLMQTMPPFVYLIPAVFFFDVGRVPGVMATVVFSMPPAIRLTNLGLRQVPVELIEAADAFGSTVRQKLFKVQLPVALPTIMAGINQCIMLALSMVVISAMIGGGGLGREVMRGITRLNIGLGAEAGLAVVIIAIILDRITESLGRGKKIN